MSKELSNEKKTSSQQLPLFPEHESAMGLEVRWLDYSYDWIDIDASVLRSCAGFVQRISRDNRQALAVLSVLKEMYDER